MERSNPLVSIVIAAHNEGENVRRTVESLLTHADGLASEIVLVDDGSADSSFEFLKAESLRDDVRLRRYRFEASAGCIHARHQGARLARGRVLAFLDAHVAVSAGWLGTLVAALERWGPHAAVTPAITPLNPEDWSPGPASGQVMTIDERLDFAWAPEDRIPPTGLAPTVVGCCMLMPRQFYFQVGGFDLGLRRWGCEFIDLILKVYAAGGVCTHEPAVVVGHLFRSAFPYPMRCADVTYNKLRTGYVHLPDASFARLLDNLRDEPGFSEALAGFQADLSELDHLRRTQRAANRRDPEWFVRTFLPGLLDGPAAPPQALKLSSNGKDSAMTPERPRTTCPKCGATNVGAHTRCLICQAPLSVPAAAEPPRQAPAGRKFCVQCGAPLKPGRQFCTRCGRKL